MTGRKFPLGLGLDFAGSVVATGDNVQEISTGMEVWGMMSPKSGHRTGAAAQYVVVPADRVSEKPGQLSMIDAASLVTSGTTSLRALRDTAKLRARERVLVRGGAGGVGVIAVQLARVIGGRVTVLASARDLDFVAELGAEEALDYRNVRPGELGRFDVILDTVGTDLLAFRRRLARAGRMVTIAFGSGKAMASIAASTLFGPRRIRTFSSYPDRRLLSELAHYVESGAVRPVVGSVYPMQRVGDAHRALDESGRRGKLVLNVSKVAERRSGV
jgi:NADPH:quinone reductase-like Zn-dependent oxidoreductase